MIGTRLGHTGKGKDCFRLRWDEQKAIGLGQTPQTPFKFIEQSDGIDHLDLGQNGGKTIEAGKNDTKE
jgi:hypothetical protein